jgi:hypothetical protein
MKVTLVKVVWLDARGEAGWVDDEPINKPMTQYGIDGGKTKDCQILYTAWDPQFERWGNRYLIPLGMIIETIQIKEDELA